MKSILQSEKECFVCHTTYGLEVHHICFGSANRKKSTLHGLCVWLCAEHHRGNTGVHFNKALDTELKQMAQAEFEKTYTREEFIREFGKSYL
jgi:hypothetical protein